jgi:hypothetical protein
MLHKVQNISGTICDILSLELGKIELHCCFVVICHSKNMVNCWLTFRLQFHWLTPNSTFVHIIRPSHTDFVHSLTAPYIFGWVLDLKTLIPYHYR